MLITVMFQIPHGFRRAKYHSLTRNAPAVRNFQSTGQLRSSPRAPTAAENFTRHSRSGSAEFVPLPQPALAIHSDTRQAD
jgi:hypothetical protein